jgi:hypothetical protein
MQLRCQSVQCCMLCWISALRCYIPVWWLIITQLLFILTSNVQHAHWMTTSFKNGSPNAKQGLEAGLLGIGDGFGGVTERVRISRP